MRVKVICAYCKDPGFAARNWQAYHRNGMCKRQIPKSAFSARPDNLARDVKNGTLECKARN
eukprot:6320368-Pyramimonas_sp.AAC.1